jgi:putative phosphoesterase
MKRILVFSDTHGDISLCKDIIEKIPSDIILHAGDYVTDAQNLKKLYPDKRIEYVKGNGDAFSYAPSNAVIELDRIRIFITHGHNEQVKTDTQLKKLIAAAKENNCTVAVFGHTHIGLEREEDGIKILNPGSSKYGRCYGVIEIEDGKASVAVIGESTFIMK